MPLKSWKIKKPSSLSGNALLHAKTAVIDGVWSTVGSTNLDYWSLLSDDELSAVILSREFAVEVEPKDRGVVCTPLFPLDVSPGSNESVTARFRHSAGL